MPQGVLLNRPRACAMGTPTTFTIPNGVGAVVTRAAQADLFADRKFAVDQAGWQPETIMVFFLKLYIGT